MFKRSLFSILAFALISFTHVFADQGSASGTDYMWTSNGAPGPQTNFDWIEIGDNTPNFSWAATGSIDSVDLPAGFDFSYFGSARNQFWISTNGWLSFTSPGTNTFNTPGSLPAAAAPAEIVAPYWSDLESTTSGSIYVDTVGTAPFRKIIVQWEVFLDPIGEPLIFETILYETTNLVKFQYKTVDPIFNGPTATATIGLQENSSSAETFHDQSDINPIPISSGFALLWHGEALTSADATIIPTTMDVNTLEIFTYTIDNIVPSATDVLGKIDRVAIYVPVDFSSTTVTGISVNDSSVFIQNSAIKPTQRGFATWQKVGDSLIVRTADFEVINSLIVNFVAFSLPASAGNSYGFASTSNARLDTTSIITNNGPASSVLVNPETPQLDYLTITGTTSITAGAPLTLNVNAFDQNNNPFSFTGDVVFTASGTGTSIFSPDTLSFSNSNSEQFTVSNQTKGTFNIRAEVDGNPSVYGVSNSITVNAASASSITVLSSQDSIKAGADRLLQVAVNDVYGNRLGADSTVNFSVLSNGGTGSISLPSSVATDANGIAQVSFTASTVVTATSGVNDVINVSSGAASGQINMVVKANNVSYYSFSPTGANLTAGDAGRTFTITARDQFGNTTTSASINLSTPGSTTASIPGSATFSGSQASVLVTDTKAETFIVKATNSILPNVTGTSGNIVVDHATITNLNVLSSSSDIKAGSERLIQVALEDDYNNPAAAGEAVIFNVTGGGGTFEGETNSVTVYTNSFGIADTVFISGTAAGTNNVIQVSYNLLNQNIIIPIIANNVSYYSFNPSSDTSFTAGDPTGVDFTITALDQYDNLATSTPISITTQGTATASFNPTSPVSFTGSTANVTVTGTEAGVFTLKATKDAPNIAGTSGLVTVNAGAADQFAILSSSANITAATSRILRVQLQDQFNNALGSGINVTFTRSSGTGLFSNESNIITGLTDADGIAEATYTASATSGGTDVIDVTYAPATPGQISLTVVAGTLARLKIQKTAIANGFELADTTLTADGGFTVYAAGYDAAGNFIGLQNASWTGYGVVSGNLTPGVPANNATFDAVGTGAGSIRATVSGITDNTGGITVTAGVTASIDIMNAPNNEGSSVAPFVINAGQAITLFANGFDSDGNFSGNVPADWSAAPVSFNAYLNDNDRLAKTNILFLPETAGNVTITADFSALQDQVTNITVNNSSDLAKIVIQKNATDGGPVLGDTTISAVETLTAYAVGYDRYNNFLGTQDTAVWTGSGILSGNIAPTTNSTFVIYTPANSSIGSGKFNATVGSISGSSGLVTVVPGPIDTLKALGTTTLNGAAGSTLSNLLEVQALDAKNNPVADSTINWAISVASSNDGGAIAPQNGGLTDAQGISRASWTLRNTTSESPDNATASYGLLTPVTYTANLTASSGNSLSIISPAAPGVSGTVGSQLTGSPFRVRVLDTNNNPVQGVPIAFSIIYNPPQADGDTLTISNTTTDVNGEAATVITLGTKVGSYIVAAYNAGLSPTEQKYTYSAGPGIADSLVLVSSPFEPTVNTTVQIQVKAVDQYGNARSGVNINWNPAVANNGPSGTDGIVSVNWTLGDSSGTQTLTASLSSPEFTLPISVNALPGAATDVQIVSGNNSTTVAGSTQRLKARVVDAFGNGVANQRVDFTPLTSMSALNSVSNDTGYVTAVYRTPSNLDSSNAQVALSGIATRTFKVYGIRYFANSLAPKGVNTGDANVPFSVVVNNPGPSAINLSTANTIFSIPDLTPPDENSLLSPVLLSPRDTTRLYFNPITISGDYPSGSYTPEITLVNSTETMNGTIHTNPGELSISPLQITSINIPSADDTLVTIGSTIRIEMQVMNNSSQTIDTFNPTLNFAPSLVNATITPDPDNPTSIAGNTPDVFRFDVNIGTAVNTYTVDGRIFAEIQGTSDEVFDLESAQTATFRVVQLAQVQWLSYSPDTVSVNQQVGFSAQVFNNSNFDVFLTRATASNDTSTRLVVGSDVYFLAANQSLLAMDTTTLTFAGGTAPTTTSLQLFLRGTQEGNPFYKAFSSDTIATTPDLTIQTPANLAFNPVNLSSSQVSQGQENENFTVTVANTGQADVVINSINDIKVLVNANYISMLTNDYTSTLTSHTANDFPIEVKNGTPIPFIFNINILDTATPSVGSAFSSEITFSDKNSGTQQTFTSGTDSWDVLSKAALSVTNISLTKTNVNPTDTLSAYVTVQNSGQTEANLTGLELYVKLNNLVISPAQPLLPVLIPGNNGTTVIRFDITVPQAAVTGTESVGASGSGTNVLSGKTISIPLNYNWTFDIAKSPTISVVSVNANRDTVSIGQQEPVLVRIKNTSTNPFLVDTVQVKTSFGNYTNLIRVLSPAQTIAAGDSVDIEVLVGITGTGSGVATLDARVSGTVLGTRITGENAIITDSWLVQRAVNTAITGFTPSVVSTGQSFNYAVTVSNSGQADLLIDTGRTILYPINSLTDSVKLSGPVTIPGGQSKVLTFNAKTFNTALAAQLMQLQLFGTDNGLPYSQTVNSSANFTVQTEADMNILSTTAAEDSVSHGQIALVTINVQNAGQADLVVETLSINGVSVTQLDNPLPFTVSGGQTQPFIASYTVPGPATGNIPLNASGTGYDANSNATSNDLGIPFGSRHSWFVATPPNISASVVSMDGASLRSTVAQGQTNIPVTVTLSNSGGTPALLNSVSLLKNIGTYTFSWPAFGQVLRNGDAPVTIPAVLSVSSNSATGVDVLSPRVAYTNMYSNAALVDTGSGTHQWTITSTTGSSVSIVSVQTDKSFVSQGQGPETVNVLIQNDGETNVTIDSLQILFDSGAANSGYTIGTLNPVLPRTINAGGVSQEFQIPVTVNADAAVGQDILTARIVYTTLNGQTSKTNVNVKDSWTVQLRPAVVIDSVVVNQDVVSTSQAGLRASVYLHNTANANRATARITSLVLTPEAGDFSTPIRSDVPGIPLLLPQGTSSRFDFTFNAGTTSGTFNFDASVNYLDINDLTGFQEPGATQIDSVVVQNAAL
ncbi:MAG: Ig-like domain-containing protein, partial [Calditrichaeota bacterium]|nr:Ig-like domain-containing protein [Calditrichota bacterium]